MSFKARVQSDLIKALKEHADQTVSVLRLVMAAVKNNEIEKKVADLSDDDVGAIVVKQVKQRKEAIELYRKGNRLDLVEKEESELSILNTYLPQQLDEKEVKQIIDRVLEHLPESDQSNFGLVMRVVMEQVKGQADGSLVAKLVKDRTNA